MSSLTPDDPGSSDLPPNVLSALRDAVEREGPLDSQALQGLTPLAQQEILAHQGQLQQAASPAESAEALDQTQRRLGEVVRNDAQPTTSSPASAEAPGPHTTSEPGPANFGRAGSELGNAQQVPSRPRGAQATAQAQAPVFTEGSDGTSPYKPPAGQRITRTLPNSRFQSSQRLPQGNPLAMADARGEPNQPLVHLPQAQNMQYSLQHQELIAKIAAAQHRMLVEGSMAGSRPFDPRGLLDPLPAGRSAPQGQGMGGSQQQSPRGRRQQGQNSPGRSQQRGSSGSRRPRHQMRPAAAHGSSSGDAAGMLADGDAEREPMADADDREDFMAIGNESLADGDEPSAGRDEPMADGDEAMADGDDEGTAQEQYNMWRFEELGGRQPRGGPTDPKEANTALVMDQMAQAVDAGPVAPEARLAMLGEANAARGYQSPPDLRTSTARKVQLLVLHPGWLSSPVDILGLYQQLHRGDLDAPLPILPSLQRIHQPITTRQLTALSRDELASVVAPSLASLHYCSAFSKDPTRQTGKNFASMAVDATCMGIVLSEAMPGAFLQCLSLNLQDHTVKEHNPGLAQITGAANMTEQQQQQVEQLWRAFKENDDALKEDFKNIRDTLNRVDLNSPLPLHDSNKTALLLELTSHLTASLGLQLEGRVHLMRTFVLSILTPFQIGHMTSMSYPYIVAWPEIVQSLAEARIAEAAAAAGDPPSPPSVQSRDPAPSAGGLLPPRRPLGRARGPRPRLQDASSTPSSFAEDNQPDPSTSRPLPQTGPRPGDPAHPVSHPNPAGRFSMPAPASADEILDTAEWLGASKAPTFEDNPRRGPTATASMADGPSGQDMASEPRSRGATYAQGSGALAYENFNMGATDSGQAGHPFGATLRGNSVEDELRSMEKQSDNCSDS